MSKEKLTVSQKQGNINHTHFMACQITVIHNNAHQNITYTTKRVIDVQ